MPDIQTLEELKAENAKTEEEITEASAAKEIEAEEEAAEETVGESEGSAEIKEDKSSDDDVESWMKSDDSGEDGQKFSNDDMAKMRKKLRARSEKELDEKESEIEKLRQKVERLESSGSATLLNKAPSPDDFDDDASFDAARADWLVAQAEARVAAKNEAGLKQAEKAKAIADRDNRVDAHYERAVKLAKEYGIDPEMYQASDLAVRKTVESIPALSRGADEVVDHLISLIGEDSEKLMYHIGRNSNARNNFREALEGDVSGIKAAILLGQMKEKLTSPKKVNSVKKPAKRADGDSAAGVSDLHRKYQRSKSAQERFDIRTEARKAGINTRDW